MSSLFLLTNISMPNNDRTGGTFLLNSTQKRCQHWYYLQPKTKKKHNSFLFLKKTTYLFYNSTTMNQIYFQNCMWLCMTLYLLTYLLLKSTYLLLVSFLFFCVFSLFVFFFFVKNQIQTTFFCKKILRTFLPPPNNVMLCFFLFLKTSESRKKGQQVKKNKTSNQQPNQ